MKLTGGWTERNQHRLMSKIRDMRRLSILRLATYGERATTAPMSRWLDRQSAVPPGRFDR